MGLKGARDIFFVLGIIIAFLVTVYIAFFTNLIGINQRLTFPEKVTKGLQVVLTLMMAILVFTVPALFLHARKLKEDIARWKE